MGWDSRAAASPHVGVRVAGDSTPQRPGAGHKMGLCSASRDLIRKVADASVAIYEQMVQDALPCCLPFLRSAVRLYVSQPLR